MRSEPQLTVADGSLPKSFGSIRSLLLGCMVRVRGKTAQNLEGPRSRDCAFKVFSLEYAFLIQNFALCKGA